MEKKSISQQANDSGKSIEDFLWWNQQFLSEAKSKLMLKIIKYAVEKPGASKIDFPLNTLKEDVADCIHFIRILDQVKDEGYIA